MHYAIDVCLFSFRAFVIEKHFSFYCQEEDNRGCFCDGDHPFDDYFNDGFHSDIIVGVSVCFFLFGFPFCTPTLITVYYCLLLS